MNIHVLVNNEAQFAAALECEAVSEIYVEADVFDKDAIERCHAKNKKCIIALPYIYRDVTYIDTAGYDGALVRSLDELAICTQRNTALQADDAGQITDGITNLISDYCLYAMNEHAAAFIADHGVKRITLPQELNEHELKTLVKRMQDFRVAADGNILNAEMLSDTETELIIYGYIPMMVSAQCIKKNTQINADAPRKKTQFANAGVSCTDNGCDRKPGILHFTDRKGNSLAAENKCAYCYNLIYNPMPLSLFGIMDKVANVGADSYRINFTIENEDEAGRVLNLFTGPAAFADLHTSAGTETFTRGHFTRGVE